MLFMSKPVSSWAATESPARPRESSSISPIDTLPVEILGIILTLVSQDVAPTASNCHYALSTYGSTWHGITVLSVCRRWRAIAFACPEFWSRLPLDSPLWAKVALERSKDASIVFDTSSMWYSDLYMHPDIWKATLQQIPRMREIVIHWSCLTGKSTCDDVLAAITKNRAPLLERLVIDSISKLGDISLFLNEPTPHLYHLSLTAFPISVSSPLLRRNLQTLELKNCGAVWEDPHGMLETLSYMPDLEHLELACAFPSIVDPTKFVPPVPSTVTKLTSLKTLKIEDSCRRVASILQHIDVSYECSIHLVSHLSDNEPDDSTPLLRDSLEKYYASEAGFSFARLSIVDNSVHRLTFNAWLPTQKKPTFSLHGLPSVSPRLIQTFEWPPHSSFPSRLSFLARSGFPVPCVSQVKGVMIPAHMLVWNDMLAGFFGALRSTRRLLLSNEMKQNPSGRDMCTFVQRKEFSATDLTPVQSAATQLPHDPIFPNCSEICLCYLNKSGLAVCTADSRPFLDFLCDAVIDPLAISVANIENAHHDWSQDEQAMIQQRFARGRRSSLLRLAPVAVLAPVVAYWLVRHVFTPGAVRLVAALHGFSMPVFSFSYIDALLIVLLIGVLICDDITLRLTTLVDAFSVNQLYSFVVAVVLGLLVYSVLPARASSIAWTLSLPTVGSFSWHAFQVYSH